jgi:hypothetical protein
MPDVIAPKSLLSFWITIPFAEHFILPIHQIWPLRLLVFRVSERSASREFIRRADELLSAIQESLRGVDRETLDAVFQEGMIRFQKCFDGNGEDIE